ncbi:hypothetical protein [Azospirillum sp. TSO22-1]|uniref:hypothetical protein n=1 Tax=Azospirillum sp. TSO22-1 TaxID=716789 RepID=UPI000D60D7AD|nr:hypothetical protein [Azospirillum sp. TSO22-1]PWC52734.1 hypothetical protein TSO221_13130 [Azospirillum sp. TSO22-1]
MRTLILLVLAAFLAVAPLSARAQTAPAPAPVPAPGAPPAASSTIFGLPPNQALAIGVGVLAGGVGMSVLTNGPFATVVGGLAGALIGNWWYATRPTVDARGLPMRQQLSAVD